jgi:CheY-like chemotaxis protein
LIESCLRQQGCDTTVVTKGSDAVREITRKDYDLVVLDWQMPDLNGAETLICAQDIISYDSSFQIPWVTNHLPVITYSGQDRDQMNLPKCNNFEIIGHIPKSFTFPQLKQATLGVLDGLRHL